MKRKRINKTKLYLELDIIAESLMNIHNGQLVSKINNCELALDNIMEKIWQSMTPKQRHKVVVGIKDASNC